MNIFFDNFCKDIKQCQHYIEWDYSEDVYDYGRHYEMDYQCCSCELVGQSHNVDTYNEFCPYQEEIAKYEKKLIQEHKAWEKKCEQEKIWRTLSDIA